MLAPTHLSSVVETIVDMLSSTLMSFTITWVSSVILTLGNNAVIVLKIGN